MRVAILLSFAVATAVFAAAPPASDSVIEAKIRAKFAKSKINEENFRVTVKSGVATLEGKTDVPQRKGVATRLARTGGAREVINNIVVGEAARQKMADRLKKARQDKTKPMSSTGPVAAPSEPPLKRMRIKH